MGAEVEERYGYVRAKANRLKGATIYLDFPSVGATENLMAAGALAEGTTVICNAAREPEIVDQQNFLNLMGARSEEPAPANHRRGSQGARRCGLHRLLTG